MSSYHSAKNSNSPASYVSSPAWSLNSLTGTTGSQAPTTPVMSSIGLPPTPPSAYADSLHGSYNYSPAPCTPPSAPRMRSVPLPPVASGNCASLLYLSCHLTSFNLLIVCAHSSAPLRHSD